MSRLIDRIRSAGSKQSSPSLLMSYAELNDRRKKRADDGLSISNKKLSLLEVNSGASVQQSILKHESVPSHYFDMSDRNLPVFAGDDVAIYNNSLPLGTDISDVVSSMAPPFNRFFVEFQNIPNQRINNPVDRLHAWGALVTVEDNPDIIEAFSGDDGKPRWILSFFVYVEGEKGTPVGPIGCCVAGLAEDGTWFRHGNNDLYWGGGPIDLDNSLSPEIKQQQGDYIATLLFPVLLTLSFLHCKNIEIKTIDPPVKLSDKHTKKTGVKLSRYHVLEITPIKRLIDKFRTGTKNDLRRALHICRGHFKTFSADAPLFGRATGTYWWAPQARGSQDSGIVHKDYRVTSPIEVGRSYQEANENPPDAEREPTPRKDPDSIGRGLAAHNKTQNFIADVIRKLGYVPRSPKSGEPEFDLAWKSNKGFLVCEVKSLTASNEERQLRMAIGQVIRYRQKLNALGHEPVTAIIATETQPADSTWEELFANENIILVWPESAEKRLSVG